MARKEIHNSDRSDFVGRQGGGITYDGEPAAQTAREHWLVTHFDHVTALPNRLVFVEALAACRSGGHSDDAVLFEDECEPNINDSPSASSGAAVVMVMLNDPKAYTEVQRALGHRIAEEFLRGAAKRATESVGPDVPIYHVSVLSLGFLVELNEGEPPRAVSALVDAFSEPVMCGGIPLRTELSVGICPVDLAGSGPAEVLRAALTAAQTNRSSPDDWTHYDRRFDERNVRAFRVLTDLPAALSAGDALHLHFQPRIDMTTGRCTKAEGLLRWTHPELGPVSPGEFMPLAEATDLIRPLTRYVITHGIAQLAAWRASGLDLALSLNIAPQNLLEPGIVEWINTQVSAAGLKPDALELEVTEGASAISDKTIVAQMDRLQRMGIALAIDDFGTGYSNLSYLPLMPTTVLKLDRSLIAKIGVDAKMRTLVQSILAMARPFGYLVVAEGIETEDVYTALIEMGCDEGQGYLMGRPMPAAQFEAWMAKTNGFWLKAA